MGYRVASSVDVRQMLRMGRRSHGPEPRNEELLIGPRSPEESAREDQGVFTELRFQEVSHSCWCPDLLLKAVVGGLELEHTQPH